MDYKKIIEEAIEKALKECGDVSLQYSEWWVENTTFKNVKKLMVLVNWGDWKHQHLYLDDVVEQSCKNNGLVMLNQWDEVTDENGSDCYSALHYYVIAY